MYCGNQYDLTRLVKIFPTSVRARGLNYAASGGSVGSLLVAQIWPVGLAHFGSGIYFFFMAVNFICIPVCSTALAR